METYCIACKKLTNNTNPKTVKIKGRLMTKSTCSMCKNKKFRFVSQGSGLLDSLGPSTPQNKMKNALWNAFKL